MEPQQATSQDSNGETVNVSPVGRRATEALMPQQSSHPCPTCGSQVGLSNSGDLAPSFVYAIGRVEPRFPTLGVDNEYRQAIKNAETKDLTDRQVLHRVLTQNRYLVRQLCWVFNVRDVPTYILQPRDPFDFALLMETLRRDPSAIDMDVVIGVRGPIAPPEICNGLTVPIVVFDQLYSFDRDSLLRAIPRPDNVSEEQFNASANELLDRILQLSDNAGSTDEHRALNYLVVRYPVIYAATYDAFGQNSSLSGVEVLTSRLSGTRKIVDPILTFTHRQTDVTEKYFVRVDVTEEFPFLVTKLSHYYDR